MKQKADVIYDGLGQEAAKENFEALALRGHWVSYGQASGAHESFPDLTAKSGTLSRPVLFHYTAEHLQEMAGRVFDAMRDGMLRRMRHRYRWPQLRTRTATWRLAAPAVRSSSSLTCSNISVEYQWRGAWRRRQRAQETHDHRDSRFEEWREDGVHLGA